MRTRVKICGITRAEDAAAAAELGVDAIGLNFFAGPRQIPLDWAYEILSAIPPFVTPVALTSGPTTQFPKAPTIGEIQYGNATAGRAPLPIWTFQYYGTSLFLAQIAEKSRCAVWGVCRISEGDIAPQIVAYLQSISFRPGVIVIDAANGFQLGGTGQQMDWRELRDAVWLCLQKELFFHMILAGGLTPENVAEAIRIARPYAVDVSSGVEVAGKPGVKDPVKMRDFIQAAKG